VVQFVPGSHAQVLGHFKEALVEQDGSERHDCLSGEHPFGHVEQLKLHVPIAGSHVLFGGHVGGQDGGEAHDCWSPEHPFGHLEQSKLHVPIAGSHV
jgi:hypothetical protein